jgi:hypothetical protein
MGIRKVIANKDNHVITLIHELSPYFVNLGKGKLKYTYLLEPYFSSTLGFEVFDGKLCLGIPNMLFDIMTEIRFFGIAYIPEHSAIFFLVDFGVDEGRSHPIAFRTYLRRERVALLDSFKLINLVRMSENKTFELSSRRDAFKLPLRKERRITWEDY